VEAEIQDERSFAGVNNSKNGRPHSTARSKGISSSVSSCERPKRRIWRWCGFQKLQELMTLRRMP